MTKSIRDGDDAIAKLKLEERAKEFERMEDFIYNIGFRYITKYGFIKEIKINSK